MSRNVSTSSSLRTPTRKPDPRVRHTRETLGDALVKLMHEKPFEEITVQHILDRAGVSRSTFYTHFSDKNDLFFSDVEEFFEMTPFALSRPTAARYAREFQPSFHFRCSRRNPTTGCWSQFGDAVAA